MKKQAKRTFDTSKELNIAILGDGDIIGKTKKNPVKAMVLAAGLECLF